MPTPAPQRIVARTAEIGGTLPVNRVLPTRQRRQIGAWCFLDHAGPARFESGEGMHVGAHPHTCLQTFTHPLPVFQTKSYVNDISELQQSNASVLDQMHQ